MEMEKKSAANYHTANSSRCKGEASITSGTMSNFQAKLWLSRRHCFQCELSMIQLPALCELAHLVHKFP